MYQSKSGQAGNTTDTGGVGFLDRKTGNRATFDFRATVFGFIYFARAGESTQGLPPEEGCDTPQQRSAARECIPVQLGPAATRMAFIAHTDSSHLQLHPREFYQALSGLGVGG